MRNPGSQENLKKCREGETHETEAVKMLVLEMMPMEGKWRKGKNDGPDLIIRNRLLMD